jgi:DNA modification methylase
MSLDLLTGDAFTLLPTLPAESVHCCVTSPPYWGLRDYGNPDQIGIETTPAEYVEKLVAIFREVRRVLRADGTLWLNLGDSYAMTTKGSSGKGDKQITNAGTLLNDRRWKIPCELKPKDLVGIPWRVAFALQADGWYLRSDIIWSKPNPMPESVTDRPTKAHEYVFLLAKSERYYYDAEAIKESSLTGDPRKPYAPGQVDARGNGHDRNGGAPRTAGKKVVDIPWQYRNKRSVWTFSTCPTPDAHFATYPIDLVETCILAGCPTDSTVLDPFSGAGTTGLACLKTGRNYLGIELNPDYVRITHERARRHYSLLAEISA